MSRNRACAAAAAATRRAPSDRDAALAYLSITLSHPRWLVARWLDRLGFEATERWLQFNNAPAPLTLRANRSASQPTHCTRGSRHAESRSRPGRFAPDAVLVDRGDTAGDERARRARGQFVIQDEASQLVALLAGTASRAHVLDTCASPGGKTTALAAPMPNAA